MFSAGFVLGMFGTCISAYLNGYRRVTLCAVRCERGEMSDQERVALADKLADVANRHLWRAHEFARAARSVRTGER